MSLFHLKFVSLNVSLRIASSGLGNLSAVVICPVSIKFASFLESSFNSFNGPLVAVIALFNFTAAAFGSAFIIASHASIGPPNALVTTARQPPGIDLTFLAKESITKPNSFKFLATASTSVFGTRACAF